MAVSVLPEQEIVCETAWAVVLNLYCGNRSFENSTLTNGAVLAVCGALLSADKIP